jgi:hypothetical protein
MPRPGGATGSEAGADAERPDSLPNSSEKTALVFWLHVDTDSTERRHAHPSAWLRTGHVTVEDGVETTRPPRSRSWRGRGTSSDDVSAVCALRGIWRLDGRSMVVAVFRVDWQKGTWLSIWGGPWQG